METLIQLAAVFGGSFMIALSGALMPGPLLAVTITESTARGPVAGPLLMLGHMILEGVLVAAIALGLATFLQHPAVIAAISFGGGAVLIWMGWGMVRARGGGMTVDGPVADGARRGRMHPVVAGVVVSLANPYWTIWWVTIGLAYAVAAGKFGVAGVAAFFVGHILADFTWYGLVSFSVARGRKSLPDRVYRWLIRVCGITLLLFAVWFIWGGVKTVGVLE
jgi:threonine/homoserine/homoserine lactone efflux protein